MFADHACACFFLIEKRNIVTELTTNSFLKYGFKKYRRIKIALKYIERICTNMTKSKILCKLLCKNF